MELGELDMWASVQGRAIAELPETLLFKLWKSYGCVNLEPWRIEMVMGGFNAHVVVAIGA